ncbi:MAG: S9 family peptidase [Erysipelotrichia bacterium]|nr:S9 family peptidase [Erysipelotrichia bacterium]
MNKIKLEDFLTFKFISNIKMNHKQEAVFCVHTCDEGENNYQNNLYMLKEGKTIPLTSGNKESNFIFLDDDTIVFTTLREKQDLDKVNNGEELTCFYKLSLRGGEAVKYFSVPLSVASFLSIDEHTFILQVNYDTRYSHMYKENDKSEILKQKKADADYEVFTQIPFYFNNGGYTSGKVSMLFMYEVKTNTLTPITSEKLNINQFIMNETKDKLYFVANETLPRPSLKESVHMYDLASKEMTTLVEEKEYNIYTIQIFNDHLLMVANKEVTHGNNENPKFFTIDVKTKQVHLLHAYADSIGNSVGSDCRYGYASTIQVYKDRCYFVSTIEEKASVFAIDAKGNIESVLVIDGSVDGFAIEDDMMVFIAMKDNQLQEVYTYDFKQISCQTHLNTTLIGKYVSAYEEVQYENDGISLTGWVLLPENYDSNKRYPAILDIHGGPKTVYGKVYYHEMQVWANMGYIVFFTNPRGSDGRGNDFMDIFGKYGTIDYADLMKFCDVVLERYAIDPKRVGVTGGSYGGFMSNWIITHTDRFACAATQRSISNWLSFYGTSDIGFHFAQDQIHGNIFTSPEKLWEHSPLKYANNVKTPTLFIHSDEDYRCPLEQGLQLYTALVDQGIEARFVMFKQENHELSRSGKPLHRVKRLQEITNWMETHLK